RSPPCAALIPSFSSYGSPLVLPSFPTRRSSDLVVLRGDAFGSKASRLGRNSQGGFQGGGQHLPVVQVAEVLVADIQPGLLQMLGDRKSTRLNSSHVKISYAVFCLKKKRRERARQ